MSFRRFQPLMIDRKAELLYYYYLSRTSLKMKVIFVLNKKNKKKGNSELIKYKIDTLSRAIL